LVFYLVQKWPQNDNWTRVERFIVQNANVSQHLPIFSNLLYKLSGRAAARRARRSATNRRAARAQFIVPALAARWQQIPPNYVNLKCDFF
jgi:hypothetical protein